MAFLELGAFAVALLAAVALFVPAIAESAARPHRSSRLVAQEPFPAGDRTDLSRRLGSGDTATFTGAFDPAVVGAMGPPQASMLPRGSRVDVATRFVAVDGVGAVQASVTGPRPGRFLLHLVRESGRWRVFSTDEGSAAGDPTRVGAMYRAIRGLSHQRKGAAGPVAVGSTCADPGRALPVLLVHGFADSPKVFGSGPSSLGQTIAKVPGVVVVPPFDYSADSLDWVDAPAIGPALAVTIDCLARASARDGGPGRVVVVAHSMGALATRFAAAQRIGDRSVADEIDLVVTLGAPNEGSYLASEAANLTSTGTAPSSSILGALVQVACPRGVEPGQSPLAPVCEMISQARSPAADAMTVGSPQLAALAPFPADVPVVAIAGDVRLTVHVFDGPTVVLQHAGDLVVDEASALDSVSGEAPAARVTVACDAPLSQPVGDIRTIKGLSPLELLARAALYKAVPPCSHLGLPSDVPARQAVVAAIESRTAAAP